MSEEEILSNEDENEEEDIVPKHANSDGEDAMDGAESLEDLADEEEGDDEEESFDDVDNT